MTVSGFEGVVRRDLASREGRLWRQWQQLTKRGVLSSRYLRRSQRQPPSSVEADVDMSLRRLIYFILYAICE